MDITIYFAFLAIALIIALGIMPLIINLAKHKGFYEANDERKTHTERVSSFGGVGIFLAFMLPVLVLVEPNSFSPILAFGLAVPLFIVSLLDDVYSLRVAIRFSVHAAIGLALYQLGFSVANFEGLPIINAGATIIFTIALINAYNLIDGINGLAGVLGVISSVVFGVVLGMRGEHQLALACFAYTGALLGYLAYNFGKKAQIFMGDNGSTVMGLLTATMAMAVLKSDASAGFGASFPIVLAVVSVPLVDMFKVSLLRVLRKRSPFSPDRTHLHHLLTDNLLSHPAACTVLASWTIVQVCLASFLPAVFSFQTVAVLTIVPYLMVNGLRSTNSIFGASQKGEVRSIAD